MKIRNLSVDSLPVVIIDDLIPEKEAIKLRFLLKTLHLERMGYTRGGDPSTAHFAAVGDYERVKDFPFYKKILQEAGTILGEEVDCERLIYREFVFGDQPEFHVDANVPGYLTAIFYLNEEWQEKDRGETLFSDKDGVGISVLPAPGRAVIFDARVNHTANAPSRTCYKSRQLLVLNLYTRRLGPLKY